MIKMFFSFEGRTRRFEYAMSVVLYLMASFAVIGIGVWLDFVFINILHVALIWFFLAQRVQRCHDLGKSGFYMLIPLFGLLMLFAEGVAGPNEYGPDPKGKQ